MSVLEIAIIAVIALAVFFALRTVVRMRKSGGCSCGCSGCSGCCASCGMSCEAARKK